MFHQAPWRYNCAQSVAAAHAGELGLTEAEAAVSEQPNGGGRAPGGICGALHVALRLHPEHREQLLADFAKATGGYTTCRDIKQKGHVSCQRCVELADELLAEL